MYFRLEIRAVLLASLVPTSLSAQIVEAGIVRDAVRGAPYECLHVALLDSAGKAIAHTVTDSAGRFLLEAPRPGAYRVQFNVFLWEPLAGPVDTLKEGDSRQRAYPLAFRNMLAPDSTALPRRPDGQSDGQEYRRRYQVLQAYAREQESDSGWRSRSAIPRPINLRYPDWLRRSGVDGLQCLRHLGSARAQLLGRHRARLDERGDKARGLRQEGDDLGRDADRRRRHVGRTLGFAVDPEQLGVLAREPNDAVAAAEPHAVVAVGDPAVERHRL